MDRLRLIHMDNLSCEAILREMPNGELLCVSQCGGLTEPAPGNRVYAFHSKDNGETWSKKEKVYPEDGQAVYLTEVMVIGNEVTVFITVHNGFFLNWKCCMMKSTDNGYTWYNAGVSPIPEFAFIRGMIRLKNGNILLSYHYYPIPYEEQQRLISEKLSVHHARIPHVENGVLISSDNGNTYKRYFAANLKFIDEFIWSEPTVIELSDGTLAMLLRYNGTGYLWRCDSKDGGETWSDVYKTDIPNPSTKAKLIGMPDGKIALLNSPNSKCGFRERIPVEIWISDDDMTTWSYKHKITDFPGCYSYPDGYCTPDSKHIMFTFEFNRHDIYFVDHEINY